MKGSSSRIRLKSFSFLEKENDETRLDISNVNLDNFDLFIGDNAQGKTRIFHMLRFIKDLLTQNRKINSIFYGKFVFDIEANNKNEQTIYEINITPNNETNNYSEKITKGKKILLSTMGEKCLLNEKTNEPINNFFLPNNLPAISAINDPRFETIKFIREFFLRLLFIDAKKNNRIHIQPNASVINPEGTNLASVLLNWKNNNLDIFQEVINDFKRCFPVIDNIKFAANQLPSMPQAELLALREKEINKDIPQLEWSEGMWRTLCILILPKTLFNLQGNIYPPSLIFIDEVENGLDFKTLGFIVRYLEDYRHEMQIIISSHSPSISEYIHPKNWQIVKRKGLKIQISKPQQVESDLEEQLDIFRQKYWDFYTKHINNSQLYEPK